jgi:tripartite-type tricarboxylate transporter receptor subunit TctC
MLLPRRRFLYLNLAAGAAALPTAPRIARAQTFPSRPVRIVVPTAAGGPNDILTRLIGQRLSERLGQPFIVENRPGAGTNLATELVVRAPPDGYTYFSAGPASAINATLYDKLSFNFIRDTAPVAGIMRVSNVLVVHPSFPAKTIPEFIAYARANPGKLSMASGGIGSGSHMAGELFKMMAGVDMVHVPYRGAGPALADLLGGQVQVMFDLMPNSIEHIRAGKLRGLAVTTATRSHDLPDIPTIGDFVPGYEASAVFGIVAPRDTPADTVDKLNREINASLADPSIKARLAQLGGTVLTGSAADFGKLFAEETAKWGKVIRAANIKVE